MSAIFRWIADNTNPNSLASRMRRRRFELFRRLLLACPHYGTIRILDLGGDMKYWRQMLALLESPVEITLLNLAEFPDTGDSRLTSIAGDSRDLSRFDDNAFDIVYSNSLIEHFDTFADQRQMASEIQRVGRAYFVQTPNRYFPLEPHFLLPYFQFFPRRVRIAVAGKFRPGWYRYRQRSTAAIEDAATIHLLNLRELQLLFPDAHIWRERIGFLTKSFVAYHGFEAEQ